MQTFNFTINNKSTISIDAKNLEHAELILKELLKSNNMYKHLK